MSSEGRYGRAWAHTSWSVSSVWRHSYCCLLEMAAVCILFFQSKNICRDKRRVIYLDYTTKLQSLRQDCTGTRTEI